MSGEREENQVIVGEQSPVADLGSLGEATVKAKYGERWPQALEDGRRAVSRVPPDQLDRLEDEIGVRAMLEGAFELGRNARGPVSADRTIAAIKALNEIAKLKSNKEFTEKFLDGDLDARDKMARLHERAYPSEEDAE